MYSVIILTCMYFMLLSAGFDGYLTVFQIIFMQGFILKKS